MNNTGRKVVKGSKTSAPMVMTSTSAAKASLSKSSTAKPSTTTASTAAAAPPIAVKAAAAMTAKAKPTLEEIARRSYEIFVARGGTDGHDLEDWVQAERDLGA